MVIAVPFVGDLLHHRVVEVAAAEAEHGEEDARFLRVRLSHAFQVCRTGDANIKIAVGAEDDAIDGALDEVLLSDLISELDAGAAGGRAARLKLVERGDDFRLIGAGRALKREPLAGGVDDDRDAVVLAQLAGESLHPLDQERQLVRFVHRTGNVNQEH